MPCFFFLSSTATFSSTLTYSLRFFNEQKKRTKESYLAWLDSISFYDVICLNHGNWLPIHRAKMCEVMNRELKQQRRRRLQKCYSKSEVALPQTLSPLFHLVQFVKCLQFFPELNSKRLYRSSGKEKRKSLSCVHVLQKTWN